MSMSSFKSAPRIGYLERVKRIIGYLSKMKEAKLRVRVSLPDYSDISYVQYNWGNQYMEIPEKNYHMTIQ